MSSATRHLPNLERHLRWLIAFRLVMISSVLVSYLVFELSSRGELPEFNLLFVLVAATYIASILHIVLLAMLGTAGGMLRGHLLFAERTHDRATFLRELRLLVEHPTRIVT